MMIMKKWLCHMYTQKSEKKYDVNHCKEMAITSVYDEVTPHQVQRIGQKWQPQSQLFLSNDSHREDIHPPPMHANMSLLYI